MCYQLYPFPALRIMQARLLLEAYKAKHSKANVYVHDPFFLSFPW